MKPSDFNIFDLIPQRPPMVMIDKLIYADEKTAKGIFFVNESNPLCFEDHLLESGMIECIAQTAAAFTGYSQLSQKKEVKRGYIGSIKNLKVYSLPATDTEIQPEITLENELLGFTIITGRIMQNNKLLAECEMRILIDDGNAEK
jgi:predicted hotdog family 3-hydroxylacyl-ACP dehydratase